MKISALDNPVEIKVLLPTGKVFEADLSEELAIDTSNLEEEFFTQPAKYAWWSVLLDLAESKVKMATQRLTETKGSEEYSRALEQYTKIKRHYVLLSFTMEALLHRETAILSLCSNTRKRQVQQEYRTSLFKLRALISA